MKKFLFRFAQAYLGLLVVILIAGFFFRDRVLQQNVDMMLVSSSGNHWFGTDSLGRDVFWRVVQGGQVSVLVGLVSFALSLLIGCLYGGASGWLEGTADRVLMRAVDVLLSIPSFVTVSVLCLGLQMILPVEDLLMRSFISLCCGIAATHWMGLARVTRGLVMETKRRPFIEASRALGATPGRIFVSHILPNIKGRLGVVAVSQIPTLIMYESLMSFIGLGVQPPWTSWGLLLRDGWKNLSAFPHLILFPSLILFLTMWSFNIVFDRMTEDRRS